jgi:hypothetical protein
VERQTAYFKEMRIPSAPNPDIGQDIRVAEFPRLVYIVPSINIAATGRSVTAPIPL